MRWTDRQQAMLAAMGLQPWGPQPGPGVEAEASHVAVAERPVHQAAGPSATAMPHAAERAVDRAPDRAVGAVADRPREPAGHRVPDRAGPSSGVAAPAVVLQRAPSPVDGADWPALREAVAGCTACALSGTRTQTVFGVGNTQARLMVVGEAPGADEDRQGEPFVGKAGQLLDRMLAAIGQARGGDRPEHQVFIANTLKCRPPGNRNPTPEEMACCAPFLERQLALVQPRVVLAMGRFAVQSLLKTDAPIGRLRGQVHDWQGRPLVVTYHPAYLLRQPTEKARAWDDLCRVAELLADDRTA